MTEKIPILLVVDDRPDNLYIIEQLINEYIPACIVNTAPNPDIALQMAQDHQPDGILSDIQMPGKSGIELCRQLKQIPQTSHIPVLLITSHKSDPNLRVQGLEAGADDLITRPIDNLELAARIKVMFRIKHIQDDLIEAKDNLEKIVAERTENLQKANDQLKLEIEEHRRVEEALLESERKYRALFEKEKNAVFIYDPETMLILDANPAMSSTYRYSYEELVGMNCLELSAEVDESLKAFASADEEGRLKVALRWHKKKDGVVFPLELDGYSTVLNGKTVGFTVINDITDSRKAEEALSQSEKRFRTIFEQSPLGIALIDSLTGQIHEVNPMFAKISGRTRKEMTVIDWMSITHPDDVQEELDNMVLMNAGEIARFNMNKRYLHPDGTQVWVNTTIAPIEVDDVTHPRHLCMIEDITSTKQVREELAHVFELSPDLLCRLNVNEGYFKQINPAFAIFGRPLEEFISRPFTDFIHPDDQNLTATQIENMQSGKSVFGFENRYRCKDGSYKIIEWNTTMAQADGNAYATGRDITDQKKAEVEKEYLQSQLSHAQKMEAIGTLAGGIAHDFNNILGVILGYAEMVRDDSPEGSLAARDLNQVLIAGHRAKELVKQILAFSRQTETEKIPLQPAIIVKEAIKLLRASIPTTIAIEQDIDMQCDLILADPTAIHQILMNLCTNAFHAMEIYGGTLSISLKMITLCQKELILEPQLLPGNYVQLSVRDTGTGIEPEIQKKIFDPYFTTKETGKGTGMGLAITHGIIKSYGGFITCESRLGEGTVFHITLPISEENILPESNSDDSIAAGTERILLVDDEQILADMGKTMLERLGYKVTVRMSSLEALTTFKNQPDAFDLVITDQTMPGMTGADLAQRILQIQPGFPIILCTGYSSTITEEKALSLGIKGFALKPLTKKDIALLIRKVIDE